MNRRHFAANIAAGLGAIVLPVAASAATTTTVSPHLVEFERRVRDVCSRVVGATLAGTYVKTHETNRGPRGADGHRAFVKVAMMIAVVDTPTGSTEVCHLVGDPYVIRGRTFEEFAAERILEIGRRFANKRELRKKKPVAFDANGASIFEDARLQRVSEAGNLEMVLVEKPTAGNAAIVRFDDGRIAEAKTDEWTVVV